MNDTFASKKVCQDDRWPWGDDIEKKKPHETTKKHWFFPVFWPPLEKSKKPWEYLVGGVRPKTADECKMGIFPKSPPSRNTTFSDVWRPQNGLGFICGPPRGTFLYRACSAETFFGPLFWRPFLGASSPKRFYPTKIVVSALWRNAKTSQNLGLSWVHLRPPMGSFAAPWNRAL